MYCELKTRMQVTLPRTRLPSASTATAVQEAPLGNQAATADYLEETIHEQPFVHSLRLLAMLVAWQAGPARDRL